MTANTAAWEGLTPPYATVVADPPWPQKGRGTLRGREGFGDAGGRSDGMRYSTMSVGDIAALPVLDLVADDAHIYLWTTNGFLPKAFGVLKAWGFAYSTTIVWAKEPIGYGLGGAHGIAAEFLLFARRGHLQAQGAVDRNWHRWKRPYVGGHPHHSAKPPAALDLVEQVSPGPYVELFARAPRLGWDHWGLGYEGAA